jgi:uncharacterized protein with NRDE domain
MCLLALFFRVADDAAVVVGANREEEYSRGGTPPQLVTDGPGRFVAGLDPVAGGTWLGVNEHGVLAAVTNRRKLELPPRPRSRGLLVRDLFACRTAKEAADRAAAELGRNRYAGCNVLCADAAGAWVLEAADWLRVRPLPPGLHVLTNHDINDTANDRRLAYALEWLGQRDYAGAAECVAALKDLCAQAGDGGPPICLHGDRGGTTSSSIIVLRQPLDRGVYLHAQGPPDVTPYADYSALLRELSP